MKSIVDGFDGVHLLGESAMHPPAPRSGRHAALLLLAGSMGSKPAASSPLQGAGLAETGLLRAVQQHAGAVGAAALSLAWHLDHGTGGRIQRPFLAACRTFIPGEAFAQNLSEFGAPQGKSCFANVVSTWTFAL
jgi:hypothetical protein